MKWFWSQVMKIYTIRVRNGEDVFNVEEMFKTSLDYVLKISCLYSMLGFDICEDYKKFDDFVVQMAPVSEEDLHRRIEIAKNKVVTIKIPIGNKSVCLDVLGEKDPNIRFLIGRYGDGEYSDEEYQKMLKKHLDFNDSEWTGVIGRGV